MGNLGISNVMRNIKIYIFAILLVSILPYLHAQQSEFQGIWICEGHSGDYREEKIEINGTRWSFSIDGVIEASGNARFSTGSAELLLANGEKYFTFTLLTPGLIEYIGFWTRCRFRRVNVTELRRQADENFKNQNWDRAIEDFTKLISISSNDATNYHA